MIRGAKNKKLWQSNEQQPYNGAHIIFTTEDGVNLGHYDASDNSECPYLDTYRGVWLSPQQIKEWCYLDDLIAQANKAERLQKAVDLALERFDDIRRLYDKYYDKYSVIATETTEEIKQLIKGE